MAFPDTTFDSPPHRPGAEPKLDINASGLTANRCQQPVYHRMTKALVGWLRYHFGTEEHIEYANLTGRVHNGMDREASPIFISSLAEWAPKMSQNRPALLVDRLDQDKDLRGIGDQFQGFQPGRFAHFMRGTHVVHVLGGREGEAEDLAAETWRELTRFGPGVRVVLKLHQFLPMKIGKRVQLSEEHKEVYTVPIIISYGWEEVWKMDPLDEAEIKVIKFSVE